MQSVYVIGKYEPHGVISTQTCKVSLLLKVLASWGN